MPLAPRQLSSSSHSLPGTGLRCHSRQSHGRSKSHRPRGLLKQSEKHREHVMRPLTKVLTLTVIAALGILAQAPVLAAEITVLAGMGNVSGIQDLAPAFERASGHKVIGPFLPAADLPAGH